MKVTDPSSIHRTFADAANSGDLDRLASLFTPDGLVIERDGGRTAAPTPSAATSSSSSR